MKTPKVDMSGVEAANRAMAEASAAASNLNKNFKADLNAENLTKVDAGGSAAAAASDGVMAKRRKRTEGGLSSTLGVNI